MPARSVCAALAGAAVIMVGVASALSPLAGLGAVIAVGVAFITLAKPAVGALIAIALAPATSGFARGLPFPGLRLSELIAVGIGFLIYLTRRRRARVPWTAFEWMVLTYVVATAGLGAYDLLSRGAPLSSQNLGGLFGPLQFLILYLLVASAITTNAQRATALAVLVLASVPVSILALLQQFNLAGARQLIVVLTGTDIYQVNATGAAGTGIARATGPFAHWHQLAAFLAIAILIIVGLLLERRVAVLSRRVLIAALVLACVALVQTVTITAIAIAVIGVLALGQWYGRLKPVLGWMVAVALVGSIAFAPLVIHRYSEQFGQHTGAAHSSLVPSTVSYRYGVWTHQWFPVLNGRWLTGYGPDIPTNVPWPYPESLYLEMALRGGILLLIVLLGLMFVWGHRARGLIDSDDPMRRLLARLSLYLVLALGVAHIIVPYFVDSGTPHLLVVLAGLTFGAATTETAAMSTLSRLARRLQPSRHARLLTPPGLPSVDRSGGPFLRKRAPTS